MGSDCPVALRIDASLTLMKGLKDNSSATVDGMVVL